MVTVVEEEEGGREASLLDHLTTMMTMMLSFIQSLRLFEYLLDPSTAVTHVVAIGLLFALRLQGVGARVIALVSITEGFFAYFLWRACPSGLGTIVVLWAFLNLYEYVLGPRISVHQNAVLLSGDSYVEVVLKQATGIEFRMTTDDRGQFCVLSKLGFAAFFGALWFKQIDIDERICLDEVVTLREGCTFEILKRFRSAGIQRERLISLTMDENNLIVVLVAESRTERDQWMAVLHHILGTQIVDIRSAWLSKIMFSHCLEAPDGEKKIRFEDAVDILSKAGRPYDRGYANELLKKITNGMKWKLIGATTLNKEQLSSFFSYAIHRPEIVEIYNKLIDQRHGKVALNKARFHEFVRVEQREEVSKEMIRQWIQKNEPVLRCFNLSHIGFSNYLLDEEHSIFRRDFKQVYQDMNQPLSHYYVATSHNTYLTKDQLTSKSSVDSYINAFKRGCKCVELDLWDGTNNEPVIYHGYTLTSKILVRDVIQAIKDYAFCLSPFPVILSFENHCSAEQQKIVARYLREILGDLLYSKPIPEDETQLPSPSQLKGYVIVKGKKLKSDCEEAEEEDEEIYADDELPEDLEIFGLTNRSKTMSSSLDDVSLRNFDAVSMRSENDEDEFTSTESIKERRLKSQMEFKDNLAKMKRNAKMKESEKKLAKELSDLVVYCQPTSFKGFEYAAANNKHYEMVSIGEKRAFKLARDEATSMIRFNERQLSRIYPAGARIDSTNFDPVAMWNVGCQLVAMNYQTPGLEMQLNQALFRDNGACGYVLKPKFLREELSLADPRLLTDNFQTLKIRVISGSQIPYKNDKILKTERSLSVQVKVFGFYSDVQCSRTKIIKNSGLNPVWNEDLIFRLHVPDLAFLFFSVLTKDSSSGHYALPVRCMQQGYRTVPLLNKFSEPILNSHLMIHVAINS